MPHKVLQESHERGGEVWLQEENMRARSKGETKERRGGEEEAEHIYVALNWIMIILMVAKLLW